MFHSALPKTGSAGHFTPTPTFRTGIDLKIADQTFSKN